MRQRARLLFCLALLTLPANAMTWQQSEQPQPQRPSLRDLVMKPVVYSVPGMEKVTVKSNLKYTTVENPNLLMARVERVEVIEEERRRA